MLSKRVSILEASLTLKISAKAKQMKKQGLPVIDFSVGEPDFPTMDHVKAAGKKAIDDNFTRYTQSDGAPELKEAILSRLLSDESLDYRPNQLIVSPGAKASIFLALAALVNDGEEVLIPSPYWVSYPEQVKLVGGIPVLIETREADNFLVTPAQIKAKITPRTRVLIINSPSNPTGMVYSEDQLRAIMDVAMRGNLVVIADEIYSKIIYDGFRFTRIASLSPEIAERTVTIDGVSKAYSMTGWRIGFALGPQKIIGAMKSIQDHLTSNPCSISQMAALAAYAGEQGEVVRRTGEFQERRDFLLTELNRIPGVRCGKPQGAFYLFPNIRSYFNTSDGKYTIRTAFDLADYLLEKANVATVPGEGFGASDNIRLSFATSMENIRTGAKRIAGALGELGKL